MGQSIRTLQIFVAKVEVLAAGLQEFGIGQVCRLNQGFALFPVTEPVEAVLATRAWKSDASAPYLDPHTIPLCAFGANCSKHGGPVALISIEYLGKHVRQQVSVWREGALSYFNSEMGFRAEFLTASVNEALKLLGVKADRELDEFDTLDLGRYPHTYCWHPEDCPLFTNRACELDEDALTEHRPRSLLARVARLFSGKN